MISEFAHCYFFLRVFKFFKTLKNVFCLSGNVMEAYSFFNVPSITFSENLRVVNSLMPGGNKEVTHP